MHAISGRYRKPKGRPSKKKSAALAKFLKKSSETESVSINSSVSEVENTEENSTRISTSFISTASTSKLSESSQFAAKNTAENVTDTSSYTFMSNSMWSSLLCNVKCDECFTNSLDVINKGTFGYSSKIELICKSCEKVFSSIFSSPRVNVSKCFEANKKLVEAFLKIGKGHAALEVFSMVVGIHAMDKKTFSRCLNSLYEERKNFKEDVLDIARNIVRKKHEDLGNNNDIIDITVSYDGTWQKRGHTSLYGIDLVIEILTGLVIDFEILSKYCPECVASKRDLGEKSIEFQIWYESHKPQCSANHTGSSNSMEIAAAEAMWKRSISNCNMRYVCMLSDGDAKTHQHLSDLNVYGTDVTISKEECINHVAKRLGTGLRNKVKEWKGKGVTLGGRKEGSLKEETIVKLTNFYRKAVKDNAHNVDNMKSAIYATLLHCSSSDKAPKHSKCPKGTESWCFYQRAIALKKTPALHKCMKTKLSDEVVSKILPVYQRLASTELLSRCLSGKTQNANESVHSVIWKNCPKETFI